MSLLDRRAVIRRLLVRLANDYRNGTGIEQGPGYTVKGERGGEWGGRFGGPVVRLLDEVFDFAGVPHADRPGPSTIRDDLRLLGLLSPVRQSTKRNRPRAGGSA
jgi:hypothetical protein